MIMIDCPCGASQGVTDERLKQEPVVCLKCGRMIAREGQVLPREPDATPAAALVSRAPAEPSIPLEQSSPAPTSPGNWLHWWCPGAGFASVGMGATGVLAWVTVFLEGVCFCWLAVSPGPVSLYAVIGMLGLGCLLNVLEGRAIRGRLSVPSASGFLVHRRVPLALILWICQLAAIWFLVLSFGSFRIGGTGMSPTLERGERVFYWRRVERERARPGTVIVYRNAQGSAWGEPGAMMVGRILAGPGDRLAVARGQYVVNGQFGHVIGPIGELKQVVHVPESPQAILVPEGCHFVVQDSPYPAYDSLVLSWIRDDDIISTDLWRVSADRLFERAR